MLVYIRTAWLETPGGTRRLAPVVEISEYPMLYSMGLASSHVHLRRQRPGGVTLTWDL